MNRNDAPQIRPIDVKIAQSLVENARPSSWPPPGDERAGRWSRPSLAGDGTDATSYACGSSRAVTMLRDAGGQRGSPETPWADRS